MPAEAQRLCLSTLRFGRRSAGQMPASTQPTRARRDPAMTNLPPAEPGMPLAEVDTPALLIDLDAFERNLQRMAEMVALTPVKLRAHAKTHKSPVIALKQIRLGAVGVCCQKVSEAEAMVRGGVGSVLVSNEVAGRAQARPAGGVGARGRCRHLHRQSRQRRRDRRLGRQVRGAAAGAGRDRRRRQAVRRGAGRRGRRTRQGHRRLAAPALRRACRPITARPSICAPTPSARPPSIARWP